ncbi:MAG TPA: glycosyltransferase family 39 protein, partial [Planctomycetota bacterium]|nr:glycosyltransferase family 39 protein [Planctomycetota bacterium]
PLRIISWQTTAQQMMRSGDYFHPYLFDEEYFDKPLLSYWLMIGCARIFGVLNEFTLRLPGVLAGLLAIFCTVRIGTRRFNPTVGLTAGWLLATSFFFIYWSRQACSDMLSLAAVIGAAAWYTERRDRPGFVTSAMLFLILAVGGLMKGLIAPVLAVLVILPDFLQEGRWRRHLRPSLALAWIPAALVYLAPFLAANSTSGGGYESNGLVLVFKENILRYFKPFDHTAPFYVYAEYMPLYAVPWSLMLPFVLWRAVRRWRDLSRDSRWVLLAGLIIFLFLSLSGGRRNYYILPILPFVMLAAADWIHHAPGLRRRRVATWTAAFCAAGILVWFGVALPIANRHGDTRLLGEEVREAAEHYAPWPEWKVVLYDTKPQMGYYLNPSVRARRLLTPEELDAALKEYPRTIVVTYAKRVDVVAARMDNAEVLKEKSILPGSFGKPKGAPEAQVVFIPRVKFAVTPRR